MFEPDATLRNREPPVTGLPFRVSSGAADASFGSAAVADAGRAATLIRAFRVIVCEWWPHSGGLRWDGDFTAILGYANDEIGADTSSWTTRIHPEDVARVLAEVDDATKARRTFDIEYRLRRRDGSHVWIHHRGVLDLAADGSLQALYGLLRDVSARKVSESTLREHAEWLRLAVAASNVGLWQWDVGTPRARFSPEWKRQLGYGEQELDDCHAAWEQRLHPDDRERVLACQRDLVRQQSGAYEVEYRMRHRDGGWRWFYARGDLVAGEAEAPLRMLGCHIDITERKRSEQAKQALEAQLARAQKMEALGQLAGGIAHDFNNILFAIMGNADLARDELPPGHPARHRLAQIGKASERARELIGQILMFSRNQAPQRRVTPLTGVVADAARLLRATTPASIELVATLDADAPPVLAEPTQIQQLLMNLCANAVQAMRGIGGRIEIALAKRMLRVDDAPAGLASGPHVVLTVRDDGVGMDAATLERIFDPFFTTKAPGEGTGLGLAVVDGIVKAHNGAIRVQSELGHGTTFAVYLPAAAEAAAPAAVPPPSPSSGCGQRILYIDDEEWLVELVTAALGRYGYEVVGYTSSIEALAAFDADPDRFAIVVTDMSMPGPSGLDVARHVLARDAGKPVALASGYVSDALQVQARAAGVRKVVYKPTSVRELAEHVHQLVAELAPR